MHVILKHSYEGCTAERGNPVQYPQLTEYGKIQDGAKALLLCLIFQSLPYANINYRNLAILNLNGITINVIANVYGTLL